MVSWRTLSPLQRPTRTRFPSRRPQSPPAFTDLLAGRIDLFFDSNSAGLPYVQSGQAKGIAVLSSKRSPLAPDVPTMSEAGVPSLDVDSWLGIFVPAKTPPEIIAKLRTDIQIGRAHV